ncbi:MAG: twin-arginine translocation signal domain-containing protein [Acidobacteriota bacterium]
MKITRRKFLKAGSSVAALGAGALLFPGIATGQVGKKDAALDDYNRFGRWDSFNAIANFSKADFDSQIGTEFNLLSSTYGHRIVSLVGVREPTKQKVGSSESFSLLFKGKEWQDVNQDIYYVSHAKLGYFHVLMAPVRESRNSSDLCYEAVINRLI